MASRIAPRNLEDSRRNASRFFECATHLSGLFTWLQHSKQALSARSIFGDFLHIRVRGFWWWSLGMTELLIYLRGIEQAMMDMCAEPDELHRLMAFLRDAHLAKIDFLEQHSLFTPNHDGPYVGSGGFGYTHELPQPDFDGARYRARDLWGFAESQETTCVSADMFEEFIFPEALL